MCLVKSILAVIVIAALAIAALWYFQSPSGTWIVDRQANHEESGDDFLERVATVRIPDLVLFLAEDGDFTLLEGSEVLLTGKWTFENGELHFENSPFGETEYSRPGRLTIVFVGTTVIFKRQ